MSKAASLSGIPDLFRNQRAKNSQTQSSDLASLQNAPVPNTKTLKRSSSTDEDMIASMLSLDETAAKNGDVQPKKSKKNKKKKKKKKSKKKRKDAKKSDEKNKVTRPSLMTEREKKDNEETLSSTSLQERDGEGSGPFAHGTVLRHTMRTHRHTNDTSEDDDDDDLEFLNRVRAQIDGSERRASDGIDSRSKQNVGDARHDQRRGDDEKETQGEASARAALRERALAAKSRRLAAERALQRKSKEENVRAGPVEIKTSNPIKSPPKTIEDVDDDIHSSSYGESSFELEFPDNSEPMTTDDVTRKHRRDDDKINDESLTNENSGHRVDRGTNKKDRDTTERDDDDDSDVANTDADTNVKGEDVENLSSGYFASVEKRVERRVEKRAASKTNGRNREVRASRRGKIGHMDGSEAARTRRRRTRPNNIPLKFEHTTDTDTDTSIDFSAFGDVDMKSGVARSADDVKTSDRRETISSAHEGNQERRDVEKNQSKRDEDEINEQLRVTTAALRSAEAETVELRQRVTRMGDDATNASIRKDEEIASLRRRIEECEKEARVFKADAETLRVEYRRAQEQAVSAEMKVKETNTELDILKQELIEKDAAHQKQTTALKRLHESELARLKKQFESTKEYTEVVSTLRSSVGKLALLESKIATQEKSTADMRTSHFDTREKMLKAMEISSCKRQQNAQAECERLQSLLTSMQFTQENAAEKLAEDRARLREEHARLKSIQADWRAASEAMRADLSEDRKKLRDEQNAFRLKTTQNEANLGKMRDERDAVQREIEEMRATFEEERRKWVRITRESVAISFVRSSTECDFQLLFAQEQTLDERRAELEDRNRAVRDAAIELVNTERSLNERTAALEEKRRDVETEQSRIERESNTLVSLGMKVQEQSSNVAAEFRRLDEEKQTLVRAKMDVMTRENDLKSREDELEKSMQKMRVERKELEDVRLSLAKRRRALTEKENVRFRRHMPQRVGTIQLLASSRSDREAEKIESSSVLSSIVRMALNAAAGEKSETPQPIEAVYEARKLSLSPVCVREVEE